MPAWLQRMIHGSSTLLLQTWLLSPSWTRIRWQTTENGQHSHPTATSRSTWTFCTPSNVSLGSWTSCRTSSQSSTPASSSAGHPPPPHYAHYPGFHPSIKQEDEEEWMEYHHPPTGPQLYGLPPRGPHYGLSLFHQDQDTIVLLSVIHLRARVRQEANAVAQEDRELGQQQREIP